MQCSNLASLRGAHDVDTQKKPAAYIVVDSHLLKHSPPTRKVATSGCLYARRNSEGLQHSKLPRTKKTLNPQRLI